MPEKVFFIPVNVPSLKTGAIKTKWGIVPSKSLKMWRRDPLVIKAWEKQREAFIEVIKTIPMPYFIHMTFTKNTTVLFDYMGPGETIADEMVHRGWLNDDNAYQFVPIFGKFNVDRKTAGVYIRILSEPPQYKFI